MLTIGQVMRTLDGGRVLDADGADVGRAAQVFLDDSSGHPLWVTVETGASVWCIPLSLAEARGHDVLVPFDRAVIEAAPSVGDPGRLDDDAEARLLGHYGLYGAGYEDVDAGAVARPSTTDRPATGGAGR